MARKKRKRRLAQIRTAALALLITGLAAFVLFGLFRIRSVDVLGSERYAPEQIQSDLIHDFWTQNTLYFAWKYRNATTDPLAPYLSMIQAKVLTPSKVRLTVQEKQLAGYVQYAGSNVYFDSQGEVLEITDDQYADVPLVTGVTMGEPALYQKLPVTGVAQMNAVLKITSLLNEAHFLPDSISFDENLNITLVIGSVTAELGQNDCLDEKVANLATIYPQVEGQSGTLNLESLTVGGNEDIPFKPREDAVDPTDGEDGQTTETDEYGNPVAVTAETDENGNLLSDSAEGDEPKGETVGLDAFMAFDSSGTLRYDAHVVDGQVLDANGVPIDGCTVNEDGYVVDAYMNVIDPYTGQPIQ